MGVLDFRFQISDCRERLVVSNPQFLAPSPQPPVPRPRRRGASILEVLFAILVTTIGLLGAVAVFPVASAQARKGRIADASAIAGRSAVNTVNTRGMLRPMIQPGKPGGWMAWNPAANSGNGDYTAMPAMGTLDGLSFCLDPRFVAWNDSSPAEAGAAAQFPYDSTTFCPRMGRLTLWNGQVNALGNVVVNGAGNPLKMDNLQADSIFVFDDDLTVNRFASTTPDPIPYDRSENSRPAAQAFYRLDHDADSSTPMLPMKRNSDGQLSWMATFVPKHELYLSAPVVFNDQYVLSIVIFNQRPAINLTLDAVGSDMYRAGERVLGVEDVSGYAGGEALLYWPAGGTIADTPANYEIAKTMLKFRSGNWIMLAKDMYHPATNLPRPIFRWYRVTDAQAEPEYHPGEQHYEIQVSLSGQDWEMTPAGAVPPNLTYAIVIEGVVAVYEKTVRLEAF